MAAAMDSAIVYSSPAEPLPMGSTINLQGAVWQHMRANNTGSFVSINPSFHARPDPVLGTQLPQLQGPCVTMQQSMQQNLSPLDVGIYQQMRRSHCKVVGTVPLTGPITRLAIRGDSNIAVNLPSVMQAIAQARSTNSTGPTAGVDPNLVLNGGTLSSLLMLVYHVGTSVTAG